MIGAFLNGTFIALWAFLVGVDALTWSEAAPAIVINTVAFVTCLAIEALS